MVQPYFKDIDKYDDALKVVARTFKKIERTKQPLFECFNNDEEINKELNKRIQKVKPALYTRDLTFGHSDADDVDWDRFWEGFKAIRRSKFDYKGLRRDWLLGKHEANPDFNELDPYIAAGIANWPISRSTADILISEEEEARLLPFNYAKSLLKYFLKTKRAPVSALDALPPKVQADLEGWYKSLPDEWVYTDDDGNEQKQECKKQDHPAAKKAAFYWFCTLFAQEIGREKLDLLKGYRKVTKNITKLIKKQRADEVFGMISHYLFTEEYYKLRDLGDSMYSGIGAMAPEMDLYITHLYNAIDRLRTMWSKKYLTKMLKDGNFGWVATEQIFTKELEACIKLTFYPWVRFSMAMKLYLTTLTKVAVYLKEDPRAQGPRVIP